MNKQNLLTITLIVTGLALNPAMGETVETRVVQGQTINHSVASGVSTLLFNRGLDQDAADEMASNLVGEEDEMLLALLMHNLEMQNIVTKEEVLAYLSTAALYKQKLDFHAYDNLVGMVSKIKQKPLEQSTLAQLRLMAKQNAFILG